MVVDFDDFGANHVISAQCQSHDCRDKLLDLKEINPAFKTTLFAIPGEMTPELLLWSQQNKHWIELAWHGFWHSSNEECKEMPLPEFRSKMESFAGFSGYFINGFKAPGWQISDDIFIWLRDKGWWVSDQSYNNVRRPPELPGYINYDGKFYATKNLDNEIEAWHGHTWDCVGNGIYETFDRLAEKIKPVKEFKFVSEVV